MMLPSAADLVRAFVKDLANVFEGETFGAAAESVQVTLSAGAGALAAWTADRDYVLTNVISLTNVVSWVLSFDGVTVTNYFNNVSGVFIGNVLAANAQATGNFPQRTPIPKGRVLRYFNGGASQSKVLLTLEVRP